ncbi:MAG: DNA modification system-associated small protein [Mariniphaga sp.]
MAKKGLDTTFLHYGIRKEDISMIETLCIEHNLEFDWVKEDLLKEFHERKIRNQEIDEKSVEKVIEKALQKIK